MKLEFIRGTHTWQFNVANGGYSGITLYVTGAINWGIAPITRITQRGPFQDGDTDIDYRLNPRIINLPIVIPGISYEEMTSNRENLIQMFKPGNDTATLKQTINENAAEYIQIKRSIDVKVTGATMDTNPIDFNVRAVIQLRADDPTWYNSTQNAQQMTYTQFGTPTPYPKPYPVPYGASSVNSSISVAYTGTVVSSPILQCIGPLSNLVIVDGSGRLISFTDTIPAASIWTVDLRYGRKTIVDQNGVNKFQYLSIDSDIVNWGLYPDPTFDAGLQYLSVSATGTTDVSVVNMFWYDRYVGI
jgi:hypothetical protein